MILGEWRPRPLPPALGRDKGQGPADRPTRTPSPDRPAWWRTRIPQWCAALAESVHLQRRPPPGRRWPNALRPHWTGGTAASPPSCHLLSPAATRRPAFLVPPAHPTVSRHRRERSVGQGPRRPPGHCSACVSRMTRRSRASRRSNLQGSACLRGGRVRPIQVLAAAGTGHPPPRLTAVSESEATGHLHGRVSR